MRVNWNNHIVSTPNGFRGKQRIKETRIPVSVILEYLAESRTTEEIIEEFPDLGKVRIAACLDYAHELSEFEVALL